MNNEYLLELKTDPRFMSVIETIMGQRPVIPSHDPRNDNTEVWKHESAKKEGFDIWVIFLRLENINE